MRLSWLPNAITIARVALTFPLLWLLATSDFRPAFWVALAAGLSDGLDGYLARRFQWSSALGGVLDPIADKLFVSVCYIGLWWSEHLPGWLVALVFGRDLVIVVGGFAWWRLTGAFEAAPSWLGKLSTALQITLVACVLANLAVHPLPRLLLPALMLATALLTLVSGLDYVIRYGQRARAALGSRK
jgi:cardiolipin synthase